MVERAQRVAEDARQPEVRNLDVRVRAKEDVLPRGVLAVRWSCCGARLLGGGVESRGAHRWLDITVHDPRAVEIVQPLEQLPHHEADSVRRKARLRVPQLLDPLGELCGAQSHPSAPPKCSRRPVRSRADKGPRSHVAGHKLEGEIELAVDKKYLTQADNVRVV